MKNGQQKTDNLRAISIYTHFINIKLLIYLADS
jgi:hypothetical protein